ncbi:DUF3169 family protein [Macrococcus sp. EM39E]|uniref:DUF3169 family protein n=1 Tax=Macrococcus animalis TaxID=3395467 RepID=UPI0039BDF918
MSSNKKLGRTTFVTLVGALFGGIIGYSLPMIVDVSRFYKSQFNFNLMFIIVPLLFFISIYLYIISKKQYHSMKNPPKLLEDEQYIYQLKQYNKASMNIVNSSHIITLAIALATGSFVLDASTNALIYYGIVVIIFVVFVIMITKHNRTMLLSFPEITNSNFQLDYEDRQLLTTIINNIDEGERLVMLHSLSKTYTVMIYMLTGLLLLLAFYHAASGENQYIGMIGISAILIYSTIAYYKKSEEFNK